MTALPLLELRGPVEGPHANSAVTLFAMQERDLRAIAAEVLASRVGAPTELALLSPLGLYCELRGLTLPRSAQDVASHYVATTWQTAELVAAIVLRRPTLRTWAEALHASVAAAPVDVLHVGLILGPDAVAMLSVKILAPLSAAETGVSCG